MADLWWLMFWLGLAVFVVFLVMLGIALVRRGADPHDDAVSDTGPADAAADVPGRDLEDSTGRLGRWLLAWGVAGPLVVLAIVFAATLVAMRATPTVPSDDALVIEVVGHQWFYEVTYPSHGVTTTDELHLPVGREVALELTSADVIHSFWVPELGGKLDMMPGHVNTLVLEADKPGEHQMRCAEFCGLHHARMNMPVVVESPADFEAWLMAMGGGGEDAGG